MPSSPSAAEPAAASVPRRDRPERLVVGLTGGIGSGKSTVGDLFARRGIPVIDADAAAHALTGPGGEAMPAIEQAFGKAVIAPDGRLDRAAMRQAAFSQPSVRTELQAILHPMIHRWMQAQAAAQDGPYLMLMIPLLIESGRPRERCDRILVVDCPPALQIERVMQRSGLEREAVLAIMAAQVSREGRLAAADDVIENTADLDALVSQVGRLDQKYRELAIEFANKF